MDSIDHAPIRMATLGDVLAAAQDHASARDVAVTLNRIYFLFLDTVKEVLGNSRWRAKRAVVHAATAAVAREVLPPQDLCVHLSDDQYLLIFSDGRVEDLAGRCKRLVDTLEKRLFGEKGQGRVQLRTATEVFAERVVDDRSVDPDLAGAADELVWDDEIETTAPPVQGGSMFSDVARAARRTNLLEMLGDAEDESVVYDYLPVCHVREGRIASYVCRPRRGVGMLGETGYDVLGPAPETPAINRLDSHAIEECLFALKKVCDGGGRVNIMTSVHFETLAGRASRAELKAFLAAVPRRFARLLTLHLDAFPDGIPEGRLAEITGGLTQWVRGLAASIPMAECPTLQTLVRRAELFAAAGIGIVSLDFADADMDAGSVGRAAKLGEAMARRSVAVAAVNVGSRVALRQLAAGGLAYLGGLAVGAPQNRPDAPRPFRP
ncbi:MAG: hypothetical protein R3F55_13200 [Alphaproteobacteria bacterium]